MSCLTGTLNALREKRAQIAADVEYLRQMTMEDRMDDRFDRVLAVNFFESVGDDITESAGDIIDQIDTDTSFRDTELKRILESTTDLTFDEMIGIRE